MNDGGMEGARKGVVTNLTSLLGNVKKKDIKNHVHLLWKLIQRDNIHCNTKKKKSCSLLIMSG